MTRKDPFTLKHTRGARHTLFAIMAFQHGRPCGWRDGYYLTQAEAKAKLPPDDPASAGTGLEYRVLNVMRDGPKPERIDFLTGDDVRLIRVWENPGVGHRSHSMNRTNNPGGGPGHRKI